MFNQANDVSLFDADLELSGADLDLVLGGAGADSVNGSTEGDPPNTSSAPPGTVTTIPSPFPVTGTGNVDVNITSTETHTGGEGPAMVGMQTLQNLGQTASDVVHQGAKIIYDFAHPLLSAAGQEGGDIIHAIGDRLEEVIRGGGGGGGETSG
jgi:hypothetical protein